MNNVIHIIINHVIIIKFIYFRIICIIFTEVDIIINTIVIIINLTVIINIVNLLMSGRECAYRDMAEVQTGRTAGRIIRHCRLAQVAFVQRKKGSLGVRVE